MPDSNVSNVVRTHFKKAEKITASEPHNAEIKIPPRLFMGVNVPDLYVTKTFYPAATILGIYSADDCFLQLDRPKGARSMIMLEGRGGHLLRFWSELTTSQIVERAPDYAGKIQPGTIGETERVPATPKPETIAATPEKTADAVMPEPEAAVKKFPKGAPLLAPVPGRAAA
jgi:hypothetical protein